MNSQDAAKLALAMADMPVVGIADWVHDNMPRISLAAQLSGGWEVWAQAEIALKMRQKYPDLDRERKDLPLGTQRISAIYASQPPPLTTLPSEPRKPSSSNSRCGLKQEEVESAFHTRLMNDFTRKLRSMGPRNTALRP